MSKADPGFRICDGCGGWFPEVLSGRHCLDCLKAGRGPRLKPLQPKIKLNRAPCPGCGGQVSIGARFDLTDTQRRPWHEECAAETLGRVA